LRVRQRVEIPLIGGAVRGKMFGRGGWLAALFVCRRPSAPASTAKALKK